VGADVDVGIDPPRHHGQRRQLVGRAPGPPPHPRDLAARDFNQDVAGHAPAAVEHLPRADGDGVWRNGGLRRGSYRSADRRRDHDRYTPEPHDRYPTLDRRSVDSLYFRMPIVTVPLDAMYRNA